MTQDTRSEASFRKGLQSIGGTRLTLTLVIFGYLSGGNVYYSESSHFGSGYLAALLFPVVFHLVAPTIWIFDFVWQLHKLMQARIQVPDFVCRSRFLIGVSVVWQILLYYYVFEAPY